MRLACLACLALALLCASARPDEAKPSAVEIARVGKKATALVECDIPLGKNHGSAFCIHPSGLFVTNEHVLRGASAVRLVLDPSLKTQKVVKASVLRLDKDNDLALVRAEGLKDQPALALGTSEGVEELMEVIAFGFPFGRSLAVEKDGYPAVSVNKGSVTSVRRKGGEPHRLQTDAALNPGNSGGPLLDTKGKVVGVVVSGVRGSGVAFVIPVGLLSRFLERPELTFAAPKVAPGDRGKPAAFVARAAVFAPGAKAPELELVLTAGGKSRRFPMKLDGDAYKATAVPLPPPEGSARLRAALALPEGSVTGVVLDVPVKIDGKERRLAEVKSLRRLPAPEVELREGGSLAGLPTGLDEIEVRLGPESVRLKLSSVVSATFAPEEPPRSVACAVVARAGGRVVAEAADTLTFPEAAVAWAGPEPAGPGVGEAKLEADKVTRALPAAASDAVMAGGGRYLLLKIPSLKRLAVFDVSLAKLTGFIPLGAENARVAAGQTKVVVALPDEGVIQRWDLATRKREAAVKLPLKDGHPPQRLAMGCASEGPVVLVGAPDGGFGEWAILDLATLKPSSLKMPYAPLHAKSDAPLRASADGRVFGSWVMGTSPQGLMSLTLDGREAKPSRQHESVGHVAPGDDGRFLYTARGVFTPLGKPVGKAGRDGLYCVPAARGPFYLGLTLSGVGLERGKEGTKASLFLAGDTRPLAEVAGVDWPSGINEWDREEFAWDRRIWLVPDAKVLITLPEKDKLVLHRLDTDAALARTAVEYLAVTSRPPAAARRGAAFSYRVAVKSKKGGVKYELSAGPKGMEVTKDGEVKWAVPAALEEKSVDVILAVSDASGQEQFHNFTLRVE